MSFLECDQCGGAIGLFCYCPAIKTRKTEAAPSTSEISPELNERLDRIGNASFEQGWREAAKWAKRSDLICDIGSPAYARAQRDAATSSKVSSLKTDLAHKLIGLFAPVRG